MKQQISPFALSDPQLIDFFTKKNPHKFDPQLELFYNPSISFRSLSDTTLLSLFRYAQSRLYAKILFEERQRIDRIAKLPPNQRLQPLLDTEITGLLQEELHGTQIDYPDTFFYLWKSLDPQISLEEININFNNSTIFPFWKKQAEETLSVWSRNGRIIAKNRTYRWTGPLPLKKEEEEVLKEAETDGLPYKTLSEAKKYHLHRSIERHPQNAKIVKQLLGTKCMACDIEMKEVYGSIGEELIDVHHLIPLGKLIEGIIIQYNPKTDFAVLCPNCHRIIHRMDDVNDVNGVRNLIKTYCLAA